MSSACKYLRGRMYKHRTTRDENKQQKFTFLCLPCFVCYLQSIKIAETVKMCFLTLSLRRTVLWLGCRVGGTRVLLKRRFSRKFYCVWAEIKTNLKMKLQLRVYPAFTAAGCFAWQRKTDFVQGLGGSHLNTFLESFPSDKQKNF